MTCQYCGDTIVFAHVCRAAPPLFDTGDTVFHRPTKETWLVAFVHGGRLTCCGWPESIAPISDCVLVQKATPEQRFNLIQDMAAMSGSDRRKSYALEQLQKA